MCQSMISFFENTDLGFYWMLTWYTVGV